MPFNLPEYPAFPAKPWANGPTDTYGHSTWPGVTEESVAAYEAALAKVEAARAEWVKARAAALDSVVEAVKALGVAATAMRDTGKRDRHGPVKRESVSLSGVLSPFLPSAPGWPIHGSKPSLHYEREWLKKGVEREAEKKRKASADEHATKAVAWLIARGKVLGTDFTVGTAVSVANDLAFDEEVARLNKAGGPVGFRGEDFCENCPGWVPGNHRCECGNRRVSWSAGFTHSFEHPDIYPEAY